MRLPYFTGEEGECDNRGGIRARRVGGAMHAQGWRLSIGNVDISFIVDFLALILIFKNTALKCYLCIGQLRLPYQNAIDWVV